MKRWIICLFSYLFVFGFANGQTISDTALFANPSTIIKTTTPSFHPSAIARVKSNDINLFNKAFTLMASDYYTNSLGYFCKKEIQIEKTLKFPFKFRLGSVAFTDQMEGKGSGTLFTGKQ